MEKRAFLAADYAVFGIMLGISALIGLFYAFRDRRSKSGTEGYLLASRSMGIFPVAVSLTVSFVSAITVLGTPAEVYVYGTMYSWFIVVFIIVAIITSQIYIPLFYNMGISSTYEYLERRFNRAVRILGTLTYITQSILYIGIVIYAPALAFNEVTGFNLWMAILSTGLVCTFYTTLGGLKAVLWTDVFQALVMCCGFLAVIIRGTYLEGGIKNVWDMCERGGRIDFLNFDLDMHVRHSFWSIMLGGTTIWLSIYAVNQSQVQRYLCCKSSKQASKALFYNIVGLVIFIALACLTGLVMYARYNSCDPYTQGCIGAPDQLLPYFVMDILYDYPGIPGLFVSCVFSGSLSTVSSGINAMATVTIEDFIKPFTMWNDKTYMWISKGLVLIYGGVCIGMAVVASTLGGIQEAAYSVVGLLAGPLVGLFTLGTMIPFANSLGAFFGVLSGIAITTWIYLGSKMYPSAPEYLRRQPLTTMGCSAECYSQNLMNETFSTTSIPYTATEFLSSGFGSTDSDPITRPIIADLYSVSYLYGTVIGLAGTIGIGVILSLFTCGWQQRKDVDPTLMAPFFDHCIFKSLPGKFRFFMRCCLPEREPEPDYNHSHTDITMTNYGENQLSTISLSIQKEPEDEEKGVAGYKNGIS